MKRTLTMLLGIDGYAVDDNGFLYKINAGGVARAMRPRTGNFTQINVWYDVKYGGKTIRFYQKDLKEMQGKAIGIIIK